MVCRPHWQDEALKIYRKLNPHEVTDQDLADFVDRVLEPEIILAVQEADDNER